MVPEADAGEEDKTKCAEEKLNRPNPPGKRNRVYPEGAMPIGGIAPFFVIIQHLLELLMIQSDKLAYLTDLSGSRGRTSGETALSAHSEEHEVF